MVVKVCGDIKNADKFVILRENHKSYINMYFSNNPYKIMIICLMNCDIVTSTHLQIQ